MSSETQPFDQDIEWLQHELRINGLPMAVEQEEDYFALVVAEIYRLDHHDLRSRLKAFKQIYG